ncbi:zinc carboxypeptidase-like [Vespa mandarinia]|uniref:zinc carboxypeptidase-like n=1 Tax=Vespa mandarinia TaxID=7446 RepID=UPI00161E0F5A|nr:zinc carboxypeptidase-like [Vespa mandarinia]XP_035741206.1 zinc carboxypeptidase-like [Vespa mandarinia]
MYKLLILSLVALVAAEKASYENYQVFSVLPSTKSQLEILSQIEDYDGFSLWKISSTVNMTVDIMVAPNKLADFFDLMNVLGTSYKKFIDNVQDLIDSEMPKGQLASLDGFSLNTYHTIDEIYAHLDNLAKDYPNNVKVIIGGSSYEGRQIKGVKLSFGQNKSGIVIEGGIHAREWISPATVLYIIDRLLNSADPEISSLAKAHDWYIFPSVNPDGYAYTHTKNRLWRKTRKPYSFFCHGSDPNRNWGYKWNTGGSSSNPCSETYAGSSAFSEIETKSLSQYLQSISDKFFAFISFHSYSQLLLFPYGHTTEHLENYNDLLAIGKKSINALAKRYGTSYHTGNVAETIYIATGSSVDWIKGTLRKQIAYTYELRDTGKYGFILPANQIIPTGEETMDSLVAMFQEVAARGYK